MEENTDTLDEQYDAYDPSIDPVDANPDESVDDTYIEPVDLESTPIDDTLEDNGNEIIDDTETLPEYDYTDDTYIEDYPVNDEIEYTYDETNYLVDEKGEPIYYTMNDLNIDSAGDGTDYVDNPVYLPDMMYTQDDEIVEDTQPDDTITDPGTQDPALDETNETMYALENNDNPNSKEAHVISSKSNQSTVNASDKSIPMQKTGAPIVPLIIGTLMVLGGLILPKRT